MAFDKRTPGAALNDEEDQDNRICALIESARVLASVERVAILQQASVDISQSDLFDARKVELLDDCVELSIQTLAELSNEYLTTTLPLSDEQEALVRMVIELTESLDTQYSGIEPDQRGLDYRHVLHRRMTLLLEQFTFSAACYMPWTPTLWNRIHGLFISAWQHKATQYRAKAFDPSRKSPTLERLYITVVLTAAADPYQMPHRDIHKARKLASAFANQVNLKYYKTYTEAPAGHHRLLVDDRVDKPALPYRAGKELDHHNVVFEIEECYRVLSQRFELLQRDTRSKDPLFVNTSRDTVIGIYRHVLVKWGWQPTRSASRISLNVQFDVVVNYTGIIESFGEILRSEASGKKPTSKMVTATSIDISDTGLGLRIKSSPDLVLRVGELIALRETEKSSDWHVAVVRWIRSGEQGVIEVGALKVPGRMHPAHLLGVHKLQSVGKSNPESQHLTRVLVTSTQDTDGPMAAQLLVHRSMGKSDLVHWLSFSGVDRMVKTMKPFLGTRYIAIYTCELTEPRKKPFIDQPPEEKYKFTF